MASASRPDLDNLPEIDSQTEEAENGDLLRYTASPLIQIGPSLIGPFCL